MEDTKRPSVIATAFDDIDAFAEGIRAWDLQWRQLDAGSLTARILQVESEGVLYHRVEASRRFLQRGASPAGTKTFGVPGEAVADLEFCGQRSVDSAVMAFPADEYECVSQPGFRATTLSFAEERLAGVARTAGFARVAESVAKPGSVLACDPALVAALRARLQRLARAVDADPAVVCSAGIRYELEFEVPAALLRALASAGPEPPTPPANRRSLAMRRVLGFIEENREEPLRVRELSEIGGVSWRTLNYAFRERFGVTPKRYLQSLRLDGARRDLRRARPGAKVADVANFWGFWHLGQFAADYRRQFAELPSVTLGRATNGSAARAAGPLSPRA